MDGISVVINTWNEEKNLPRAVASIKNLASEIIVVDMQSSDKTKEVAKKLGAKVFDYKYVGYVEPARNFALSKAKEEWILILDADEGIPESLSAHLKKMVKKPNADFYRLPRKNIVFGKWVQYARWWPDYNIRFFRRGVVSWSEIIHSVPETHGIGRDLQAKEPFAIIHHNYSSISQFVERLNRYTNVQARIKFESDYKFSWRDLISKPTSEFVSRFFAGEGYKDGVHGLAVCLLQAFSEIVLYLKVWELGKFRTIDLDSGGLEDELTKSGGELDHWLVVKNFRRSTILKKILPRFLK